MNILNRKFGCEIEVSSDFYDVKPILKQTLQKIYKENKLYAMDGYFDSCIKTNKWHLKIDSSTASEICTPISTFKDMGKIKKVIKNLKQKKIKITNNDSIHIHVNCPDIKPKNILSCWLQYESIIKKCFPRRRWKGEYSTELIKYKGKKSKIIAEFLLKALDDSEDKNSILSFYHYPKRKTIEFRISEGNLDPNHIRNWVKFCLYFTNHCKKIDPVTLICKDVNIKSLYQMIEEINIKDSKLTNWLIQRYQQYND